MDKTFLPLIVAVVFAIPGMGTISYSFEKCKGIKRLLGIIASFILIGVGIYIAIGISFI